jgi:hypothetical protein
MPRRWRALIAPGLRPSTCATSSTVSPATRRSSRTLRWSRPTSSQTVRTWSQSSDRATTSSTASGASA